uniref:RRM domain-containing protein n=1 Tax=Timema cristinae TaxID=61476 RepID=A0A7R9GX39_TIMCR|nr:unnamed protein product [Timema cristinae]
MACAKIHWRPLQQTTLCYGFVDFDRPESAEAAVQALQAKGIQAQMAKVGIAWMRSRRPPTQQEQDPTNLYIANLPLHYKENDVDQMLVKFGQVISTRILRDTSGQSKGVGFARMESKEKCDYIIQALNGKSVPECRDPLLVKFADGGNKKRIGYKNPDQRIWRETGDGGPSGYDPSGMTPNGVAGQHMLAPSLAQYSRHYQTQTMQGYTLPSAPWGVTMPQYVMQPAAHMAQVDRCDKNTMYPLPFYCTTAPKYLRSIKEQGFSRPVPALPETDKGQRYLRPVIALPVTRETSKFMPDLFVKCNNAGLEIWIEDQSHLQVYDASPAEPMEQRARASRRNS